jgi:hypothetical protein
VEPWLTTGATRHCTTICFLGAWVLLDRIEKSTEIWQLSLGVFSAFSCDREREGLA